jgi:hypothetical protein
MLTGDGGGGRACRGGAREVLTGDGGVARRRRTRGSEWRRLELVTRAKEGAKELGREGMRCGEGRGSHRNFIGVGGALGRGGRGVTVALMALTPLKTRARLRGGSDGGQVTARAASRGVALGDAGSGGRWWRRGRARSKPEVRDDRGAHLSAGRLPMWEAAIRQGATGTWSAGPAERLRPSREGGGPVEKERRWAMAGPKGQMGRKRRKNSFLNKI